ncbi:MAG: hypothetical protein ACT4PV_08505 [Planctomycetaceae bacterium]
MGWGSREGVYRGDVQIAFLEPGLYLLRFEGDGLLAETREVEVGAAQVTVRPRPAIDAAAPREE